MEKFSIWWENHKTKVITFLVFCIVCIVSFFGVYFFNTLKAKADSISSSFEDNNEIEVVDNEKEKTEEEKVENNNKIKVDIKGSVKNPGVYEIDSNKRVIDVIKMAGGTLKDSDTSIINLSKKLKDEMVIIIYTKEETENFEETKRLEEEKQEKCNDKNVSNDACINNEETNNKTTDKVNINTASLDELMSINGIGESKANSIIEYRNKNGKFNKIEDILNVSGIGQSTFDKIKNNITV